jgi:hypothetical protein
LETDYAKLLTRLMRNDYKVTMVGLGKESVLLINFGGNLGTCVTFPN